MSGINPFVPPIATRFTNRIHLVCVNDKKQLIHVEAGEHTAWNYNSYPIKNGDNILGLSGIGYQNFVFDIYFIENDCLMHGSSLESNGWHYNF